MSIVLLIAACGEPSDSGETVGVVEAPEWHQVVRREGDTEPMCPGRPPWLVEACDIGETGACYPKTETAADYTIDGCLCWLAVSGGIGDPCAPVVPAGWEWRLSWWE